MVVGPFQPSPDDEPFVLPTPLDRDLPAGAGLDRARKRSGTQRGTGNEIANDRSDRGTDGPTKGARCFWRLRRGSRSSCRRFLAGGDSIDGVAAVDCGSVAAGGGSAGAEGAGSAGIVANGRGFSGRLRQDRAHLIAREVAGQPGDRPQASGVLDGRRDDASNGRCRHSRAATSRFARHRGRRSTHALASRLACSSGQSCGRAARSRWPVDLRGVGLQSGRRLDDDQQRPLGGTRRLSGKHHEDPHHDQQHDPFTTAFMPSCRRSGRFRST